MPLYHKIFSYKIPILIGLAIIVSIVILLPLLCSLFTCFSLPTGAYQTYCKERVIDMLCLSKILKVHYNTSCFKECLFHPIAGIGEWIGQLR